MIVFTAQLNARPIPRFLIQLALCEVATRSARNWSSSSASSRNLWCDNDASRQTVLVRDSNTLCAASECWNKGLRRKTRATIVCGKGLPLGQLARNWQPSSTQANRMRLFSRFRPFFPLTPSWLPMQIAASNCSRFPLVLAELALFARLAQN